MDEASATRWNVLRVKISVAESKESRPVSGNDKETLDGRTYLQSYLDALHFLETTGRPQRPPALAEWPFLESVPGLKALFLSMSAVAPAVPDTSSEEWNPLSQRPHSALPPPLSDELGAEITALKTAVDEFTILSHEMMHIALWEPFFTGHWRPLNRQAFRIFSLMAEGYCYFFSDIVVSGAIRVRLPDGEFALDRQTPSNARFHPIRAFQALGIGDPAMILDIYLEGFRGQSTGLWQPRGTSDFAASLAAQAYAFYAGSQPLLDDMYGALSAFGGLNEFYQRFCTVPGLPTFLPSADWTEPLHSEDPKSYFLDFYHQIFPHLASMSPAQINAVKWRRMVQMRAYYAMQVRWFFENEAVVAQGLTTMSRRKVGEEVESYLKGLQGLLKNLANTKGTSVLADLNRLDKFYNKTVRAKCLTHDIWAGHRWLIAPRRAGGLIRLNAPFPSKEQAAKKKLSLVVTYLVEELTAQLAGCKTDVSRSKVLKEIAAVAALGAGDGGAANTLRAVKRLKAELRKPHVMAIWSLPLASFDPVKNRYRELLFSYQ
jgi:hypothetical protein